MKGLLMARNKPKKELLSDDASIVVDENLGNNLSKNGSKMVEKPKKTQSKKVKKSKKNTKSKRVENKQTEPTLDSDVAKNNSTKIKDSAVKIYKSSPAVIEWFKRLGSNSLGVLDDISKGSNHYILTKQLLMVGAASIVMVFGWHLSTSKEAKVLKESSFNQTLLDGHGSLSFSRSGTVVTSSKVYKSSDGKTVYVPVTFENSTPAQMPLRPNQMKTQIQYAGSVIDSSKLSAEMVGYPALDGKLFYVYVVHKPDNEYTNVSSQFVTQVKQDLVTQSTNPNDTSKAKDTLVFTVDLGAKNVTKLAGNDEDLHLKEIYENAIVKDKAKDLITASKVALDSNKPLYNQAKSLESTLTSSKVKLPTVPTYALEQNDGNIYGINFDSNFRKGFFPQSSYGPLKSQYLGSGYTQNSDQFSVGLSAFSSQPQFTNNTDLTSADASLSASYQSLSSTYSQIITNKQTAYVSNAQQIFTLQYQFDTNLNEKQVADNDSFDITTLKN